MIVKLPTGVILESNNLTVIHEWEKAGYKEYTGKRMKPVEKPKD
jgi:hypothetical protein